MIKVSITAQGDVWAQSTEDFEHSMAIYPHEIDKLIADLQEASVRLKAGQLTKTKSSTEKLEEEIAQLKERVNMLEYNSMRKL